MKTVLMVFLAFLLMNGCAEKEKVLTTTQVAKRTKGITLNDIWALKKIKQQVPDKTSKQISLEFNLKEKKFYGNDGCNQILGALEKVTDDEVNFGLVAGTLMACKNMKTPQEFTQLLGFVKFYKIKNLHLYLLDENKQELLDFLKVD